MNRRFSVVVAFVVAAGAVFGAVQITSANSSTTDESVFVGMTPTRLLDTREGQTTFDGLDQAVGRLDADSTYELDIAERAGIPQDAVAAVINMVAVDPTAAGYLTVWPCSDSKPLAAAVNFVAGEDNGNEFSIPIGTKGDICIYAYSATDVVVDVYGYYMAGSGTPGPVGPQGPAGTGITAKGSIAPDVGPPVGKVDPDIGDVWTDVNEDAWVWTEEGKWENVGNIQGPKGETGPVGPQGPAGQGAESPARVIWVADDGTGDFRKLSTALNSITDAADTNEYLIRIAPGEYFETANVAMKNFVDVEGSGQGITTIKGSCPGSTDKERSTISFGLVNSQIRQLTIEADSANQCSAVYSNQSDESDTRLDTYSPSMEFVTVDSESSGSATQSQAVINENSNLVVANSELTAKSSSGGKASAMYNDGSEVQLLNSTAKASGSMNTSWAIWNFGGATIEIRNSTIDGGNYALFSNGSRRSYFYVANTQLVGGAVGDSTPSSVFQCFNVFDEDFVQYNQPSGVEALCGVVAS